MPQKLHVLRCYKCEVFQVNIVKKSVKWECKVCGEKQSVLRVYAEGSGRECRQHVQELNQRRRDIHTATETLQFSDISSNAVPVHGNTVCKQESKWNRYLEELKEGDTSGEEGEVGVDCGRKRSRGTEDCHVERGNRDNSIRTLVKENGAMENVQSKRRKEVPIFKEEETQKLSLKKEYLQGLSNPHEEGQRNTKPPANSKWSKYMESPDDAE